MKKKLLSLTMALSIMAISTNSIVLANTETDNQNTTIIESSITSEVLTINIDDLTLTDEYIEVGKARAGYILTSDSGQLVGSLTSSNTWDYYLFDIDGDVEASLSMSTTDENYYTTLALLIDNQLYLTDYSVANNQQINIELSGKGTLGWVVQTKSQPLDKSYILNYNISKPNDPIYTAPNGDVYKIQNEKLTINGVVQNIDFKHSLEWTWGSQWNKLHILLQDPNVSFKKQGEVEWYASKVRYYYPNALVLEVEPGGVFYHDYSQNSPYYNWGTKDALGNETPRVITNQDYRNYIIYDIDSGEVVEFISTLTKPWSELGDKHSYSW